MKSKLLIIFLILIKYISAQSEIEYIFTMYQSGVVTKEFSKFIPKNEKDIDLKLLSSLSSHFPIAHYVPDSFININYKDTSIRISTNGEIENDSLGYNPQKNNKPLEYQYFYHKYDSLSRITSYGYSGCGVCSLSPYKINISYNNENRVIQMSTSIFSFKNSIIDIRYKDNGDIQLIEFFDYNNDLRRSIKVK